MKQEKQNIPPQEKKKNFLFTNLGSASMIGMHMVSGLVVGAGMGYFFDKYFETKPWGLLFFLIVGMLAGFRNVWRDAKPLIFDKNDKNTERYHQ